MAKNLTFGLDYRAILNRLNIYLDLICLALHKYSMTEKHSEKPALLANKTKKKASSRGGARAGSGRPRGSTHKLTAQALLAELSATGLPFEQALARNYIEAQANPDLRFKYDQLFLGKLLADQHAVEIDDTLSVESRQAAFLRALETIGGVAENSLNHQAN